jgi:hypothetical protein
MSSIYALPSDWQNTDRRNIFNGPGGDWERVTGGPLRELVAVGRKDKIVLLSLSGYCGDSSNTPHGALTRRALHAVAPRGWRGLEHVLRILEVEGFTPPLDYVVGALRDQKAGVLALWAKCEIGPYDEYLSTLKFEAAERVRGLRR